MKTFFVRSSIGAIALLASTACGGSGGLGGGIGGAGGGGGGTGAYPYSMNASCSGVDVKTVNNGAITEYYYSGTCKVSFTPTITGNVGLALEMGGVDYVGTANANGNPVTFAMGGNDIAPTCLFDNSPFTATVSYNLNPGAQILAEQSFSWPRSNKC